MNHIGFISSHLPELFQWCRQQNYQQISFNKAAFKRREKYFGYKSNYCSIKPDSRGKIRHRITKAEHSSRISRLGDKLFPGWNQCSVYKYEVGGRLNWSWNHPVFLPKKVLISTGECCIWMNNTRYQVMAGQIVSLTGKYKYRVEPVKEETFHIEFSQFQPGWEKWIPGSKFLSPSSVISNAVEF